MNPVPMRHALALAMRGQGLARPNPAVGCVVMQQERCVGRGWTQPGGRPHAEAMALEAAGEQTRGARVFVTLEPCAHVSERGPSCADLLLAAGVAQVHVALLDPDPRTAGRGVARLRAAGIDVSVGMLAEEAARHHRGFLLRTTDQRPAVTLKLATTLDGRIALADGSSRWITGPLARAFCHQERAKADVVMVGRATALADNPRLDVRLPGLEDRQPRPLVFSRSPDPLPPHLHLHEALYVAPDVATLLQRLAGEGVMDLLVEGGAGLAAALLHADRVDRLLWFTAPLIVGAGVSAVADFGLGDLAGAHGRWQCIDQRTFDADRLAVFERMR